MDQLVVQAIVTIAQGHGKKTVAEFVTDEGHARLDESGIDYAQGFHVGRPRPPPTCSRTPCRGSASTEIDLSR